ncbi:MAG: hypothetical protein LBR55_04435 [Bacteroidales bacterium]|jgi:hypothetical protein|nr:hypothetical protein [Bacteroidales bacterium]
MKKLIFIFVLLFPAFSFANSPAENSSNDCTITVNGKTIPLYGKVQIVNSFPDLKVQVVTSFPDLKVQTVSSFADQCGKWEFVTSFPDFTIEMVTSFPDLKIEFVSSFPGRP